jgi:hypothetical protein
VTDISASDFAVLVRQIGLHPAGHEIDELRAAYQRLRDLLPRLDTAGPATEAQALSVFDPTRPI